MLRWKFEEYLRRNKKHAASQALLLALQYLPCLLDKAALSVELIALAKMWSYRYPLLLFPQETMRAEKAVKYYLSRYDGEE
jgi:hypothetical protein